MAWSGQLDAEEFPTCPDGDVTASWGVAEWVRQCMTSPLGCPPLHHNSTFTSSKQATGGGLGDKRPCRRAALLSLNASSSSSSRTRMKRRSVDVDMYH